MEANNYKAYYGVVDLRFANSAYTQMFHFFREHCESHELTEPKVLEVGCNTGYFSRLLKDSGAFVFGVEPFTDVALREGHVDGLYQGEVESFLDNADFSELPVFDAIFFGDVLEHLTNPEDVLRRIAARLKQEGVLILSVPNITHVSVRSMLEDGQWIYKKFGLLDSTHRYFFSRHSLRKMLVRAGFGMERSFHLLVDAIEEYAPILLKGKESDTLNEHDHTFQIIARASRAALPAEAFVDDTPRRILLATASPDAPATIVRLIQPLLYYCREVDGELRIAQGAKQQDLLWADIVVAHRECEPLILHAIRGARALGISIVYDMDTLLYGLPMEMRRKLPVAERRAVRNTAASADRVSCATEALCAQAGMLTDSVALVPDIFCEHHHLEMENVHTENGGCVFVVASSDAAHAETLVLPLRKILRRQPRHSVVAIGPIASVLARADIELTAHELCPPDVFFQILLNLRNGIGLVPLDDSLYSACGSPITFYHYASCGIVTVASDVPPYNEAIESGKTGLLAANTPEAWGEAMELAASNAGLRRLMVMRAIRRCREHAAPAQAVAAWKRAFQGLPKPDAKLRRQSEEGTFLFIP